MDVFFSDADRLAYLDLLAKYGQRFGVSFLAWCLITNHVHLIAVPGAETSLARGIGEAHRRYTRSINFRSGWRGYLFQGRFHSCALDGQYLLAAVRYVLRNPVRAGIVDQPWDYKWSSARWLVGEVTEDPLAEHSQMLAEVNDWRRFLGTKVVRPSFLVFCDGLRNRGPRPFPASFSYKGFFRHQAIRT